MKFNLVYKTILEELDQVFERIDYKDIEHFMDMINKSDRIFLMGVGREGLATRAFAMRLMHYGKEVHWCWDDTTPAVRKDDLFIFTSGSGEIGHIHYVVNEIKKVGANIALITGVPDRKTAELADFVLWVPASVYKGKDNVVPSIQPMGNLFEQSLFILFDMIIMSLVDNSETTFEEMSNRHRNFE
ncbi:6-phospho-3-hexuloisomerase [Tissierella sp. P1]|uniref:6-phospho-3-hexuloisomerase n=1 Tax=Tissierella sp. P1 TaxID=1280483 RepID=UPI000BA0C623|nr:6-phospho-3-hexuloisomerase [Tissierella sp. P1]OZV12159.1 6-phospho-3-hexuloisomerase [Tissierella sp. P1]